MMPVNGSRTGVYKNCKTCGNDFYVYKSRLNISFFCCKECYTEDQVGRKLSPHAKSVAIKTLDKYRHRRKNWAKGEDNNKWKGDQVGYRGLHYWIVRQLGKASHCNRCNVSSSRYHWHNMSGDYTRDLNDWESLCAKCHKREHKIMKG